MSQTERLYIAGVGMVTPLGVDVETSFAAVKAGMTAYALSEYEDMHGSPIKLSMLPDDMYMSFSGDIEEGDFYSDHFDHVIKMVLISVQEATSAIDTNQMIPLFLCLPEALTNSLNLITREPLLTNLSKSLGIPASRELTRVFSSGRVSGVHAIDMAYRSLSSSSRPYVLIGGGDSYDSLPRLLNLAKDKRLLTEGANSGFVPGEAAAFLLVTSSPEKAMVKDGKIIAIHPPGIAEEQGHFYSQAPNLGEGLDAAFKGALIGRSKKTIGCLYSSLNGEPFWAKELGVATIRNGEYFEDGYRIEHPFDCLGDLGAASAPALIGLAAYDLWNDADCNNALVYCSSDLSERGALCLERLPISQVS